RSDADAEEIVQDAMLRAFRAFEGLRGEQFRPWLLAIVRNCWRNKMGDTARRKADGEDQLDQIASDASDPEALAIQSSEARRLNLIMGLLPDDLREVLVLREMEDFSYRQIADA